MEGVLKLDYERIARAGIEIPPKYFTYPLCVQLMFIGIITENDAIYEVVYGEKKPKTPPRLDTVDTVRPPDFDHETDINELREMAAVNLNLDFDAIARRGFTFPDQFFRAARQWQDLFIMNLTSGNDAGFEMIFGRSRTQSDEEQWVSSLTAGISLPDAGQISNITGNSLGTCASEVPPSEQTGESSGLPGITRTFANIWSIHEHIAGKYSALAKLAEQTTQVIESNEWEEIAQNDGETSVELPRAKRECVKKREAEFALENPRKGKKSPRKINKKPSGSKMDSKKKKKKQDKKRIEVLEKSQ